MATVGHGRYISDSTNYREGAFRFGGQISYDNLREHYYRDDITYFLCKGLIEEAIGKGFEVVDDNDQPLDWNDEFQDVLGQYIPELIRGLAIERRDGRALLAFMSDSGNLYFRSFTQEFYGVDYNKFGDIEEAVAKSRIDGYPSDVDHRFEQSDIDSIREIILRRREKVNSGMSYMEPIWDISIALYFVASHIAYHVARAGAGIKAVEMESDEHTPVDPLDDDDIDNLIEDLAQFGSANDVLYLPPGVTLKESLLNSAGQIKWMELFDILLARISIYTGVPGSRLKGIVPGQLEGAEVNEESYFDVLRDIQEQVKPVIKWFVRRLNDFYEWEDDPDFDILFNVREEMSEADQLDLDMKKVEYASALMQAGFTKVQAFKKAGIDISINDLEDEPDTVEQSPNNDQDDQNDEVDDQQTENDDQDENNRENTDESD